MKSKLLILAAWFCLATASAQSNFAPAHRHTWAANLGWLDARAGDATSGAVLGEFTCTGYLWSANAGWIHLGSGAPTNGIHYSNTTGSDSGVNHLGDGRLRGLAWAANLGWVNFEATGNPRLNLVTGELSGHAWAANAGWIALAGLKITHLAPGADTDGDGLPDAWERQHAPNLTVLGAGDADHDGVTDREEYLADTHPLDANDALRITRIQKLPNANTVELEWLSSPTRLYDLEAKLSLTDTNWVNLATVPGANGVSTAEAIEATAPQAFFRISAKLPLQP
jgi:hypothetical protein